MVPALIMTTLDWVVIAAYFALLFGLAWWVILQNKDTADDYFLAGRHLGWFVVGASIFASNIGSEHLVGLAGSGATSGVALAHYELHAWCLLVLGWVLDPVLHAVARVHDAGVPRAALLAGVALAALVISLVAYVITKIAVGIFAGGVVFGDAAAGVAASRSAAATFDSFWIGSVLVVVADRALHGARRHARRRLHRSAADDHPDHRLGAGDDLRPGGARRLGRAASDRRHRHVQPVEAAGAGRVEGTGRR